MVITTKYPILLGSNSPRRREILTNAGFSFSTISPDINEEYADNMVFQQVPVYLAQKKLDAIKEKNIDKVIICSDTIVVAKNEILNKPSNSKEASEMLHKLSNATHTVITGVCINSPQNSYVFFDEAKVSFKSLSDWEIDFYIKNWQPFDKAGGYGIQDFIGMIGIERIEGSFYTIMGLPIHKVYDILKNYIITE